MPFFAPLAQTDLGFAQADTQSTAVATDLGGLGGFSLAFSQSTAVAAGLGGVAVAEGNALAISGNVLGYGFGYADADSFGLAADTGLGGFVDPTGGIGF